MPRTDYDDKYSDTGQLLIRTERIVSDNQIAREEAPAQVRAALTRLSEIAQQADVVAAQGANVSQAQIKGLFTAVADEARALRRLIIALGRD